jgi:UDP-2,4-diacetamido-2,4,6-trideoxy-beta-L-altropyranose hydrolase
VKIESGMKKGACNKTLLIRADGSEQIGLGHLMRCLAIAQGYIQEGGQVALLTKLNLISVKESLIQSGVDVIHLGVQAGGESDISETLDQADRLGAEWILLDGYHFQAAFHHALKRGGKRVLLMDDHGTLDSYSADLILNQNINADANMYLPKLSAGRLLLGCQYSCLRSEFTRWVGWKRSPIGTVKKVMITLGGGDADNVTLKVLRALSCLCLYDFHVTAIAGAVNPHWDSLKEFSEKSPYEIDVLRNVQDMPTLIANSDLAISAGGSTCWELAFLGLPSLIIVMADNQTEVALKLEERCIAKNLGWHGSLLEHSIAENVFALIEDVSERKRMSDLGQNLVDGKGVFRVIERMRDERIAS